MGLVYRAWDAEMGSLVAAKLVRVESADAHAQLKHEFRVARGIGHPNLVSLYELFVDPQGTFFTMELLRGEDLISSLRRGLPPGIPLDGEEVSEVRRAFSQLIGGLLALHDAGIVHRDVKPSNVLVTDDGRVVVLDLGVASQGLDRGPFGATPVGTPTYMAPEQALGGVPTASADAWAVGSLLAEVLSGERPQTPMWADARITSVRAELPRPPGPQELADLAMALRAWEPDRRPALSEVAAALVQRTVSPRPRAQPREVPFVGRAAAQSRLQQAADGKHAGVVVVSGPAGSGKSALLAHALPSGGTTGSRLTISSRCAASESVPFSGWDQLVDRLTQVLLALPRREMESIRPADCDALVQLFPVLGRVAALAPRGGPPPDDPVERQRAAFRGFRGLLAALGTQRRLVFVVDDAAWADADSAALLAALSGDGDLNLCLVVALRDSQDLPAPFVQAARALGRRWGRLEEVHLDPLSDAESEALLQDHLEGREVPEAHRLLREARGNALLIGELAHHLRTGAQLTSLDEALRARASALDADARSLLEAACVIEAAVSPEVIGRVAELRAGAWAGCYRLRDRGLLHAIRTESQTRVEPNHDRLIHAVLAETPAARRRTLHLRAAEVLANAPAQRLRHLIAGEDHDSAYACAMGEAAAARSLLAFERAAELYRTAWRLRPTAAAGEGLGGALRLSGHLTLAAAAFLEASSATDADSSTSERLRRSAGETWLHAGHVAAGLEALAPLLRTAGVSLPQSAGNAERLSLLYRLRFLLTDRGRDGATVGVSGVDGSRLDLLWSLSSALGMIDPARGDAVGVRHLVEAVRLGEPGRLSRALGFEASCEAFVGNAWFLRRAKTLSERASALAATTGVASVRGWARMAACTVHGLAGEFERSAAEGREAEALYLRECQGVDWELMVVRTYLNGSLALLGEVRELIDRVPKGLEDAERRGHPLAAVVHRTGQPSEAWLWLDRPEVVLEAEAPPAAPDVPFSALEYFHLFGVAKAMLYAGDPARTLTMLDDAWPRLRAGGFLRFPYCVMEFSLLRARAEAALGDRKAAARSLRAMRVGRNLRHHQAFASLGEALAAPAELATRRFRQAEAHCSEAGLRHYAAACSWRAHLLAGEAGAADELVANARGEGMAAPEKYYAALTPVVRTSLQTR